MEEIFGKQLENFLTSQERLDNAFKRASLVLEENKTIAQQSGEKIQNIQSKMDVILDLYMSEAINVDTFTKQHSPLEDKVKSLRASIKEATVDIDLMENSKHEPQKVLERGKTWVNEWNFPSENNSQDKKRQIVETFVPKITIKDCSVDIAFNYLPLFTLWEKSSVSTRITSANQ